MFSRILYVIYDKHSSLFGAIAFKRIVAYCFVAVLPIYSIYPEEIVYL